MVCHYIKIKRTAKLCIRAKLRESPKVLVTKFLRETLRVASLMVEGIVISLKMIGNYNRIFP